MQEKGLLHVSQGEETEEEEEIEEEEEEIEEEEEEIGEEEEGETQVTTWQLPTVKVRARLGSALINIVDYLPSLRDTKALIERQLRVNICCS